jgi:hypothetical protein
VLNLQTTCPPHLLIEAERRTKKVRGMERVMTYLLLEGKGCLVAWTGRTSKELSLIILFLRHTKEKQTDRLSGTHIYWTRRHRQDLQRAGLPVGCMQ